MRASRGAVWRRRTSLLTLLALVACTSGTPQWDDGREEGGRLYLRACASCHGADARGGGPVATALRVPPPDLTVLASRHDGVFPRRYVTDVIAGRQEPPAHGTREMPVWGDRFGGGPGHVASLYAGRRAELVADHLEGLQR